MSEEWGSADTGKGGRCRSSSPPTQWSRFSQKLEEATYFLLGANEEVEPSIARVAGWGMKLDLGF
jgi:hypothetical protein